MAVFSCLGSREFNFVPDCLSEHSGKEIYRYSLGEYMGWWKAQSDPEIMVGDDPYMESVNFLKRVSDVYQADLKRKPTLAELLRNLEDALRYNAHKLLKDNEELEIKQLAAKTSKRKKRQEFAPGDYFSIPLKNGQNGFGRILWKDWGHLIHVFDVTSDTIKPPNELADSKVLFSVFVSPEAWEDWRWRILGGSEGYNPDKSKLPSFSMGDEVTGWRIKTGDNVRSASSEEVRGLENTQLWPPERVAWRIEAMKGIVTPKDVMEIFTRGENLYKQEKYKEASEELGLASQYAKWIPNNKEVAALGEKALKLLQESLTKMGY
jgi:Immunity protein 26